MTSSRPTCNGQDSPDKSAAPGPAGPRLVVGLTGGVASGKSAACERFAALGVPIIDADRIARDVVQPGEPALETLVAAFGDTILTPDGGLDRSAMRQRVFADDHDRRRLEAIIHPYVRERMRQQLAACTAAYVIMAVPLLLESHMTDMVHRVLVVDVPEEVQEQRLQQRDDATAEQARAMRRAQASRHERLQQADDVIDNTGSIAALNAAVDRLDRTYRALADSMSPAPGPAEG